ncbi:Ctr copper transporter family-domain-containing protein [Lipomyces kononenkoae]|uniref:Ctr copper transporter family-domain-containing protein n=1 Tax=Lipomyces kononenkoae TaxID=34357 RepID=A0ACC3T8I8_LIPKO
MDMVSMTMASSSMNMEATSTAVTSPTTSTMSMSMGGSSSCKISMLWNWYTIDSCFIATSWHVTSKGMFAGSCIGVICLVVCLEFLRRASKEYDRFLIREHNSRFGSLPGVTGSDPQPLPQSKDRVSSSAVSDSSSSAHGAFRPKAAQQAIRALLHMLQFAVAYFVMLLAMYYNGYIIICIFIGAYIGSFIFSWEIISSGASSNQEVTACCG